MDARTTAFLDSVGMSQFAPILQFHELDWEALNLLPRDDLVSILKLGPAAKLFHYLHVAPPRPDRCSTTRLGDTPNYGSVGGNNNGPMPDNATPWLEGVPNYGLGSMPGHSAPWRETTSRYDSNPSNLSYYNPGAMLDNHTPWTETTSRYDSNPSNLSYYNPGAMLDNHTPCTLR
eukprot:NODE_5975_length_587_cov_17.106522_g5810_i0.p1 GENE.NODE_5975_length_587_cov_17.106522_g5810_i0~~NODE_5975_length_587_cov_17.106522_g5810_i0.p1  ORF type:complete len:195 (+),score=57.12 NODE_5975_length_587_cov_17.106522_g5810_i0:62-586(+)